MVARRGEAPLVPPYRFRSPNKALALGHLSSLLHTTFERGRHSLIRPSGSSPGVAKRRERIAVGVSPRISGV